MTDRYDQLNLGVYLINLDRSAERLAHMTAQLNNIGLNFERIRAVDGADLQLDGDGVDNLRIDFDYWRKFHHRNMMASEIGCYMSHILALETFQASSHNFALVLEDDADIGDAFPGVLRDVIAHASEWDIVKFCASHPGIQISRTHLSNGSSLVSYITRTARATAYVVSHSAVGRLLDQLYPIRLPFDHVFDRNFEHGLKMRGVKPMPVTTGKTQSVINESRKRAQGPFRSWGDPPLISRWRVPLIRGWHESRRLVHNLFLDGGAAALLSAPKKKVD